MTPSNWKKWLWWVTDNKRKASVVGAIAQTTGETLQRAGGVSNVGAALTGNLPGVVTSASTGMPGDEDPKIVIRSVSSWNNSEPLILVDGIERPMSSVDMSSVQSISVLKDASATAVYGVKGANGVILVTTKRGNEGRAKIDVSMNMTAKWFLLCREEWSRRMRCMCVIRLPNMS